MGPKTMKQYKADYKKGMAERKKRIDAAKKKKADAKKPKRTGPIPKTRPRAKPLINKFTGKPYVGPDRYKEMDAENKDPKSVARRKLKKKYARKSR